MKRILFVDDDKRVLEGLQRMLRQHRKVWDMTFVESGANAISAMSTKPFDVIVSDMRMPGIDGAALLKKVQEEHPGTVRIVLSGHADLEATMRSVCVSHQYLAKPCQADELCSVIERACDLEELLQDSSIQGLLGNIGELPVLPKTYNALLVALSDPEVDIQKVASIVEEDQAITVKILQLVNSSYFGVRREVSSVNDATAYLGIMTIRDLVLSSEVFKQFEGTKAPGFSLEREQAHSMLVSRVAKRMFSDKKQQDAAFLAGMLHDLGKLMTACYLPREYAELADAGAGQSEPFHTVEREAHGIGHAEIGAYLLGLWGMPYPVVEAVAHHHSPGRVREQEGMSVLVGVHVADALVHELDGTSEGARPQLDMELLTKLGLSDRLSEWRGIVQEETGEQRDAA